MTGVSAEYILPPPPGLGDTTKTFKLPLYSCAETEEGLQQNPPDLQQKSPIGGLPGMRPKRLMEWIGEAKFYGNGPHLYSAWKGKAQKQGLPLAVTRSRDAAVPPPIDPKGSLSILSVSLARSRSRWREGGLRAEGQTARHSVKRNGRLCLSVSGADKAGASSVNNRSVYTPPRWGTGASATVADTKSP
ncbi:hypothetical protein SKAU_G00015980 [Synaphobranchus kaupii]|uniref:Uncharacterized protein n=1 Tax=Synaphobranchus kaupii TaxID=118154 RepID=A0A9Q1JDE5_SYNKA|nr:hypothetical protein SKAU_G00015980 [Synaphobranchus kaupii]